MRIELRFDEPTGKPYIQELPDLEPEPFFIFWIRKSRSGIGYAILIYYFWHSTVVRWCVTVILMWYCWWIFRYLILYPSWSREMTVNEKLCLRDYLYVATACFGVLLLSQITLAVLYIIELFWSRTSVMFTMCALILGMGFALSSRLGWGADLAAQRQKYILLGWRCIPNRMFEALMIWRAWSTRVFNSAVVKKFNSLWKKRCSAS